MNDEVYVIILCGGDGKRGQTDIPKQFLEIDNKPIFEHTLKKFNDNININKIVLVINEKYKSEFKEQYIYNNYSKVVNIVCGGINRRYSVFNGLKTIKNNKAKVLVHDSVRPFVSHKTINRCIDALNEFGAVYPAIPTADTIIKAKENEKNIIDDIPIRKYMMIGQTPQGFKFKILKRAHLLAKKDINVDDEVTNDCGLIQRYNICDINIVDGNRENIKITYPEDVDLLKKIFQ